MSRRTLRASEIVEFEFCQRAWSYARAGVPSSHGEQVMRGESWHQAHGREVLASGCLRLAGYALLLAAAMLAAAYVTTLLVR